MAKLLKQAMTKAQQLPPDMQDEVARLVLTYGGDDAGRPKIQLTPEEEAELDAADAEVARGEFATDAEVAAILADHRL